MHEMETINRRTWRSPLSLRFYGRLNGYVNDGERRVFREIEAMPGPPRVLDIGVGGGRTAQLFDGMAASYVGIDYTPQMVKRAQAHRPDLDFRHMDARDLSAFAGASFDLVLFSYNGLDSVDNDGRASVLREVFRVLAPGGIFVFSTFHSGWEGFLAQRYARPIVSANPVKMGVRLAWYWLGLIRSHRLRNFERREESYAILRHSAHDYGIMVHATTPAAIQAELASAGFETPARLFDEQGHPVLAGMPLERIEHFHVIAAKSAPQ